MIQSQKKVVFTAVAFLAVGALLGFIAEDTGLISGRYQEGVTSQATDSASTTEDASIPVGGITMFDDDMACSSDCVLNDPARFTHLEPGVNVTYFNHDYGSQQPWEFSQISIDDHEGLITGDLGEKGKRGSRFTMKVQLPTKVPTDQEQVEHPVYVVNFHYQTKGFEEGDEFIFHKNRPIPPPSRATDPTDTSFKCFPQGENQDWTHYFKPGDDPSKLQDVNAPQCFFLPPDEEHLLSFTLWNSPESDSDPRVEINEIEIVAYTGLPF